MMTQDCKSNSFKPTLDYLIVIDALDEADLFKEGSSNIVDLVEILIENSPKFIKVITTSRIELVERFSSLVASFPSPSDDKDKDKDNNGWIDFHSCKIDMMGEDNLNDIKRYLEAYVRRCSPLTMNEEDKGNVVDSIKEKANGIFLYATLALESITSPVTKVIVDDWASILQKASSKLESLYKIRFTKEPIVSRWDELQPIIHLICTAMQPLSVRQIYVILKKKTSEFDFTYEDALSEKRMLKNIEEFLAPFLSFSRQADNLFENLYRIYHSSLSVWLTELREDLSNRYIYVAPSVFHRYFCEDFF